MDINWILSWILLLSRQLGECLRCFECSTRDNPACGVDFKSYQFDAVHCDGTDDMVKCGLQRQRGKFAGILRGCYHLGQLQNVNESDGCRFATQTVPNNFTFEICFCSEDFCNASPSQLPDIVNFLLCACLLTFFLILRR